jgi:hypothetical protein
LSIILLVPSGSQSNVYSVSHGIVAYQVIAHDSNLSSTIVNAELGIGVIGLCNIMLLCKSHNKQLLFHLLMA